MNTRELDSFVRGNSVSWLVSLPEYLPSDGWTLEYHFATPTARQSIAATDNGDGRFLFAMGMSESQQFEPGTWIWQANVSNGTELLTVREGRIEVRQGLAEATSGFDGRSVAERMVEQLDKALLDFDGQETTISAEGVSMTFENKADLIAARNHFRRELAREKEGERLAKGLGVSNVRVRF